MSLLVRIFHFVLVSMLLLSSTVAWSDYASNEKLVILSTRPGITLPILLVKPATKDPAAVVVLFPGGNGLLKLTSNGIGSGADNFVIRTRQQYASADFLAIAVDAPSDYPNPPSRDLSSLIC